MQPLPSGTVTFLFTDLEGSTRLWEEFPDAMRPALARHDEILRVAVADAGGTIVKTTGDGLHAAFATATDAIAAAVAAQQALLAEPWDAATTLRVRMGIHTGAAEERDGDYYGPAVNRAARVAAAAHGGQIVASQVIEELAGESLPHGVTLLDLGAHRLRDLARTEHVFQIVADDLPADFPPLRSTDAFPSNLPAQLSSFVGREQDLAKFANALREARLVTLTGVGGVGKTRLAIQVGAEVLPYYPDGVWLCELAAASDGDAMAQVVAAALGVNPRPGVTLEGSILEHLRTRAVLVLLDNCEHLIDEAGLLAESILYDCPSVRILATSREGLGIDGEQIRVVRSLPLPAAADDRATIEAADAVQLFVDRARAARDDAAFDDTEVRAIADVCRRLDGIPLAIELAAARSAAMGPADIARRLDERFRLLTGGRRTSVERHHTLRATVDWSYSLLAANTARVFNRLGAFSGSFDAVAAEMVAAGDDLEPWDVIDALTDLVAKSMVVADSFDGVARYTLLETLRQYARERLDETGEADAVRRRHARHFAMVAGEIGPSLLGGAGQVVAEQRLEFELDNLRAAVNWALDRDGDDREAALEIVGFLAAAAAFNRSLGIGAWAERAAPVADLAGPAIRAAILGAAGESLRCQERWDEARAAAVAALRDGVTESGVGGMLALTTISAIDGMRGDPAGQVAMNLDAKRELEAASADPLIVGWVTGNAAAWASYVDGMHETGLALAADAVALAREHQSRPMIAAFSFVQGNLLVATDPAEALRCYEQAIEGAQHQSNSSTLGNALASAGRLWYLAGDTTRGLERAIDAVEFAYDDADKAIYPGVLGLAAATLAQLGVPEPAAAVLQVYGEKLGYLGGGFRELLAVDGLSFADCARRELGDAAFAAATARGEQMTTDELVGFVLGELRQVLASLSSPAAP